MVGEIVVVFYGGQGGWFAKEAEVVDRGRVWEEGLYRFFLGQKLV